MILPLVLATLFWEIWVPQPLAKKILLAEVILLAEPVSHVDNRLEVKPFAPHIGSHTFAVKNNFLPRDYGIVFSGDKTLNQILDSRPPSDSSSVLEFLYRPWSLTDVDTVLLFVDDLGKGSIVYSGVYGAQANILLVPSCSALPCDHVWQATTLTLTTLRSEIERARVLIEPLKPFYTAAKPTHNQIKTALTWVARNRRGIMRADDDFPAHASWHYFSFELLWKVENFGSDKQIKQAQRLQKKLDYQS